MILSSGDSVVKNPPAYARDSGSIPGLGESLEKEMATHSSILTWEIPQSLVATTHRVAKEWDKA